MQRRKQPKRFTLDPSVLERLEQLRVLDGYTYDSELLAHLIRNEYERRRADLEKAKAAASSSVPFIPEPVAQPPAPAKGAAQGPTRVTKPTKYPPSAAPDHLNEK